MAESVQNKALPATSTPFPEAPGALHEQDGLLWIPFCGEWRDVIAKPEEKVRQRFN